MTDLYEELPGSFSPSLFVSETAIEEFLCPVCYCVPREPTEHKDCGHMACQNCWDNHLKNNSTCPVCRAATTVDLLQTSACTANKIAGLQVKCSYARWGCKFTGTLGKKGASLQRHYTEQCDHAMVACFECDAKCKAKEEKAHLQNECPFRLVECEHCHLHVCAAEMPEHLNVPEINLETITGLLHSPALDKVDFVWTIKNVREYMQTHPFAVSEPFVAQGAQWILHLGSDGIFSLSLESARRADFGFTIRIIHPSDATEDVVIQASSKQELRVLETTDVFSWSTVPEGEDMVAQVSVRRKNTAPSTLTSSVTEQPDDFVNVFAPEFATTSVIQPLCQNSIPCPAGCGRVCSQIQLRHHFFSCESRRIKCEYCGDYVEWRHYGAHLRHNEEKHHDLVIHRLKDVERDRQRSDEECKALRARNTSLRTSLERVEQDLADERKTKVREVQKALSAEMDKGLRDRLASAEREVVALKRAYETLLRQTGSNRVALNTSPVKTLGKRKRVDLM